jgi:hypothetical protein
MLRPHRHRQSAIFGKMMSTLKETLIVFLLTKAFILDMVIFLIRLKQPGAQVGLWWKECQRQPSKGAGFCHFFRRYKDRSSLPRNPLIRPPRREMVCFLSPAFSLSTGIELKLSLRARPVSDGEGLFMTIKVLNTTPFNVFRRETSIEDWNELSSNKLTHL